MENELGNELRHDGWQYEEAPTEEEQAEIDRRATETLEDFDYDPYGNYGFRTIKDALTDIQLALGTLNGGAGVKHYGLWCWLRRHKKGAADMKAYMLTGVVVDFCNTCSRQRPTEPSVSAGAPLSATQAEWEALVAERDRYLAAIETAFFRWPGGAPQGAAYYALYDALFPPSQARLESIERGRGIDEANARQRENPVVRDPRSRSVKRRRYRGEGEADRSEGDRSRLGPVGDPAVAELAAGRELREAIIDAGEQT